MSPLDVTATAAWTAVGTTVDQTAASIRARVARRHEHAEVRALGPQTESGEMEPGEPLVVSAVRALDLVSPEKAMEGHARVLELLVGVLEDLVASAELTPKELSGAALLLALPSPDDVVAAWPLEALAADVRERTGLSFKITRQSSAGHPGMLELLGEASALLSSGEVDACVVAGADSYVDAARLALLDADERLHTRRNVDGFCPGEGAAALLVETPRRIRTRGARARATIASLGTGKEPNALRGSDRQSTGVGFTDAIRAATGGAQPAWLLDDLNGERYRAFEVGLVHARLGELLSGVRRVEHAALSTGDVGAATGGVLIATAISAIERGWSPGDALVLGAAEGPLRAAVRVTAPEAQR